jgi:hypothetical protein
MKNSLRHLLATIASLAVTTGAIAATSEPAAAGLFLSNHSELQMGRS